METYTVALVDGPLDGGRGVTGADSVQGEPLMVPRPVPGGFRRSCYTQVHIDHENLRAVYLWTPEGDSDLLESLDSKDQKQLPF